MTSIRRQAQAKEPEQFHQEAMDRWAHLLRIRATVAPLHHELPPELAQQLEIWLDVMQSIEATAHFHDAVLAPADSDMMKHWVGQICSEALRDTLDTTLDASAAPEGTTVH